MRTTLRFLWRGRAANLVLVAVLAFGIGSVASLFMVLDRTVLHPLPYPEPERLVELRMAGVVPIFSKRQVMELRTSPGFAGLEAYAGHYFTIDGPTGPEQVEAGRATTGLMQLLGIQPAAGRFFVPADGEPGGSRVALITYGYWLDRFGGDPAAVGSTIRLVDDAGVTEVREIVGVLPRNSGHPFVRTGVWVPVTIDPLASDYAWRGANLHPIGRMERGRSVTAVQTLVTAHVKSWADWRRFDTPEARQQYQDRLDASVTPLSKFVAGDIASVLWYLLLFAGFVLAVACGSAGNIQLSRQLARQREFATRRALGARRRTLIRQLLVESAALCGLAAAGGLIVTAVASGFLVVHLPVDVFLPDRTVLDARVLAFVALIWVLTTSLLVAAGGALTVGRSSVPVRSHTADRGSYRVQRTIMGVWSAVTVILTAAAGLMLQSVWQLGSLDPGFDTAGLTAIEISPSLSDPATAHEFWRSLVETVEADPRVRSVGAGYNLPLTGNNSRTDVRFADHPTQSPDESVLVRFQIATPGYRRTLGLRLVDGRDFADPDRAMSPRVAIVNEAFARRFFPGQGATGAHLAGNADGGGDVTIVGVVSNTRHAGLEAFSEPRIYYPADQFSPRALTLLVRSDGPAAPIVSLVRDVIGTLDPMAPIVATRSYDEIVEASIGPRVRLARILWIYAAFSLVVSALGIHGTMSSWLVHRWREVGIRSALGADARRITGWIYRTAMLPVALGVASGAAAVLVFGAALSDMLYGVGPRDSITLGFVCFGCVCLGTLSLLQPALRAAHVDPSRVLATDR